MALELMWLSRDTIAEKISLTRVIVRRHMNYLVKTGKIVGEMNYETEGRPCMLYKVWKKQMQTAELSGLK